MRGGGCNTTSRASAALRRAPSECARFPCSVLPTGATIRAVLLFQRHAGLVQVHAKHRLPKGRRGAAPRNSSDVGEELPPDSTRGGGSRVGLRNGRLLEPMDTSSAALSWLALVRTGRSPMQTGRSHPSRIVAASVAAACKPGGFQRGRDLKGRCQQTSWDFDLDAIGRRIFGHSRRAGSVGGVANHRPKACVLGRGSLCGANCNLVRQHIMQIGPPRQNTLAGEAWDKTNEDPKSR